MSDVLIRKPLLVDVAKYEGFIKDGEGGRPTNLVINLNFVTSIQTYSWTPPDSTICCLSFNMINGCKNIWFADFKTRDAAFQDLSKYFN